MLRVVLVNLFPSTFNDFFSPTPLKDKPLEEKSARVADREAANFSGGVTATVEVVFATPPSLPLGVVWASSEGVAAGASERAAGSAAIDEGAEVFERGATAASVARAAFAAVGEPAGAGLELVAGTVTGLPPTFVAGVGFVEVRGVDASTAVAAGIVGVREASVAGTAWAEGVEALTTGCAGTGLEVDAVARAVNRSSVGTVSAAIAGAPEVPATDSAVSVSPERGRAKLPSA